VAYFVTRTSERSMSLGGLGVVGWFFCLGVVLCCVCVV
jgi:hypothetical protein